MAKEYKYLLKLLQNMHANYSQIDAQDAKLIYSNHFQYEQDYFFI